MNAAVLKLTQLGFSEYEAKAYTALIRESPLTAYEIAKNSGIPSSKVYEVIRKLENRHTIQSIHGERAKMFIPMSPEEFIQNFKSAMEENLVAVKNEFKDAKIGIDTNYTWHIKDYDNLILKAKRMLYTAQRSILLLTWPAEMEILLEAIQSAQTRRIKIAVVHYGSTNVKISRLYVHPVDDTIYEERGFRGFGLVADSKEALTGKMINDKTEAIWSMNECFVIMAEDYIRHDIYLMKILKRSASVLRDRFGKTFEKLRDVYSDEEA